MLNKGTQFSIYFPLSQRKLTPSVPPTDITHGAENILIVDDEAVQLRALHRMLTQLGYKVTSAPSGEAAVELFLHLDDKNTFDLVIIDMLMPGLNGIETIEQLRLHRPDQKAVIASGYAPEKTSVEAKAMGMGWLAKPFTLQVLAGAIREALKKIES
jgi:CheY-like chemotaxis protein